MNDLTRVAAPIAGWAAQTNGWANYFADKALKAAAVVWFLTAVTGQILFAAYIFAFYGGTAAAGNFEAWNKRLMHGIIDGDPIGNLVLAAHLFLAFVITLGGPLQLVPQIRARAPTFHHWIGRTYILTAIVISLAGLYMVWTRGAFGGLPNQVAISLNAVLIMSFAAVAVRHAIARNIDTHRRWALRLFVAVNGVWFLRVAFMAWIIVNQGPVGMTDNLDGPFDRFIAFACYLVPLGVLELYLRAQDRGGTRAKFAMAASLVALTGVMGLGIFGAFNAIWLPKMMPV